RHARAFGQGDTGRIVPRRVAPRHRLSDHPAPLCGNGRGPAPCIGANAASTDASVIILLFNGLTMHPWAYLAQGGGSVARDLHQVGAPRRICLAAAATTTLNKTETNR